MSLKIMKFTNFDFTDLRLCTLNPKSFYYEFLATLDKRGQGIPNYGDKRGGERVSNVTWGLITEES